MSLFSEYINLSYVQNRTLYAVLLCNSILRQKNGGKITFWHWSLFSLEFELIAGELRSIKVDDTWFINVPNSWLNNELAACNSSLSFHSTFKLLLNGKLYFGWMYFGKEHTWLLTNSRVSSEYFHHNSYWRKWIKQP